jgi:hypothetical protein
MSLGDVTGASDPCDITLLFVRSEDLADVNYDESGLLGCNVV